MAKHHIPGEPNAAQWAGHPHRPNLTLMLCQALGKHQMYHDTDERSPIFCFPE
jgi:hypothetical protein